MTTAKKGEVVFNEEARVEWLTGFRKRKQERRKYGTYSFSHLLTYLLPHLLRFGNEYSEEEKYIEGYKKNEEKSSGK